MIARAGSAATPSGTNTVKRQSGLSTAIARRTWVVYTPMPAQGRANPTPSTARCRPVNGSAQVRLVALQHLEMLQGEASAAHDRGLGFVHDEDRDAGVHRQETVDAAQQSTTAREHDAAVEYVGGELRRRFLEHAPDGADDESKRFLDRLCHVVGRHLEAARQPGNEVAPAYLGAQRLPHHDRGTDRDLHLLRGSLPDEQVVPALEVSRDRIVDSVAADANGMRDHHARKGDDRNLGRAAADVADGVATRFGYGQTGPDRGRERLVDQPCLPRARRDRGLGHRPPLDRGHSRRHADHDLGLEDALTALDLADEVMEHPFRHDEVSDHAVSHRPHDPDRVGCATDYFERLPPDRQDFRAVAIDRNQRRLVHDDPLTLDVNEHRRGAQVDAYLLAEQLLV